MKTRYKVLLVAIILLIIAFLAKDKLIALALFPSEITKTATSPAPEFSQLSNPEQNFDPQLLTEAKALASANKRLLAVVALSDGKLAAEWYFHGYDQQTAFNIKSISKSLLSILIGAAIDQKLLPPVHTKVLPLLKDYDISKAQKPAQQLTLEHLLAMRAGILLPENSWAMLRLWSSDNWVQEILELPYEFDPGSAWEYGTQNTHLLSAAFTQNSGQSLLEFANETVFGPAGVHISHWVSDPQGNNFGGSNMFMTARDLARFGQLILNRGQMNEQQHIPEDWVEQSTRIHSPGGFNIGPLEFNGYGYLWYSSKLHGHAVTAGLGFGGQTLLIIPSKKMVLVSLTDWRMRGEELDTNQLAITETLAKIVAAAL